MASEGPRNLILEEGIFFLEDPEIGRRVHEFDENKFPFQTEECLDFIEKNILNDTRIRETVKSCVERPGLGFLKALGSNPYHVFCFNSTAGSKECTEETSSKKDDANLLVVQLLSPGSEMVYYKASHQYPLKVKPASIGLLEVQKESLEKGHIERLEVTMKDGGFAIVDGRLGFGIIQGMGIMVGFTAEEKVKPWPKMRLLGTKSVKQKLMRMTHDGIYMNFGFVDLPSGGEGDKV